MAIRLGIKPEFGEVSLAKVTPFGASFLLTLPSADFFLDAHPKSPPCAPLCP